jgi:hypothetical protein
VDTKTKAATRYESLHRQKESSNYGDLLQEKQVSRRLDAWTKRRWPVQHTCSVEACDLHAQWWRMLKEVVDAGGGGGLAHGRKRDKKQYI